MIARTGICLVAAAVAASGCGGGSDAGGGLDAVAAAADASSHTRGAQVDMAVTMSGGGIPKPMSFSGQGAMDMAGRRMHLTMDMSSLKAFMPAGSGDAIGSDASIEEVMDKFVLYMRFHGIQGTPKKWLRIDAA